MAAPNASRMTLVLFDASGKELQQFPFSAEQNRYALWMLQEPLQQQAWLLPPVLPHSNICMGAC